MASSYMKEIFGVQNVVDAPREFEIQPFCDPVNKRAITDYGILDLAKIAYTSASGSPSTIYKIPYESVNHHLFLVVDGKNTAAGNHTASYTLQLPSAEKCSGRFIHLHYIDDASTAAGTPSLVAGTGGVEGTIIVQVDPTATTDFIKGSVMFGSNVAIQSAGVGGSTDCKRLNLGRPGVGLHLSCYAAGNMWYITGVAPSVLSNTCAFV
jgi:hypothetical protein